MNPYLEDSLGNRIKIPESTKLLMAIQEIGGFPLTLLVEYSRNFLCADPRDRIYGLLALALDAAEWSLEIDKSPSTAQLYAAVM